MQKYIGTKIIHAVREETESGEGYAVEYEDGYRSWSPREAFDNAYRDMNNMSFGHAIVMLKQGRKVARAGWNGKGMYLYYVPANSYPPTTLAAREEFGGDMVPYGAYIAMKTTQGNVVPWLASQTDVLADDWQIVD
ncbi:MAG: DUF2829 domain-containing protein [Sphingopyxis sp.]|nr:DUF2829 domain-containing protein [Sphingopyxis sp.]